MGKKSSAKANVISPPTSPSGGVPASPTYGSSQPLLNIRRNAYYEADRKCRDVLCVILFGVFWVGMIAICIVANKNGNVDSLIYPKDHTGSFCNESSPNAFYPRPGQDLNVSPSPETRLKIVQGSSYYAICVSKCPMKGDEIEGFASKADTAAVLNRCLPSNLTQVTGEAAEAYSGILGNANSPIRSLSRYVNDIIKTWKPILGFGCGVGFACSIVWLILLRIFPGTIVWGSLFLSLATLLLATAVFAHEAHFIRHPSLEQLSTSLPLQALQGQEKTFKVLAVVFLFVDVILILILAFMCSRIRLAIGIVKEACRGIGEFPSLYIFPIGQVIQLLGLLAYFVVSSMAIASCATISLDELRGVFQDDQPKPPDANGTTSNLMRFCFVYNLLGVFWTQQLIQAITVCTIAGSIARYYWSDSSDQVGRAVAISWYNSFRYHLGSLLFGAALVAIVQLFRVLLEYIDRQTKHAQNTAIKVVLCCCKVCLWCLHKVVKFLSRNGYIIVAMKGLSFCAAVVDAFQLISANLLRIGTLAIVSGFVMLMGKLFISIGCTLLVFWFITVQEPVDVSTPFPPLIVTAILAYAVASYIFGIVGIAIDTILLSVCEDEKINRSTAQYYASASIRSFLDDSSAHAFSHHKTTENEKRNDVSV